MPLTNPVSGGAAVTPWRVEISPFTTPAIKTGMNTVDNTGVIYGRLYSASPAAGDKIGWDITLGAGTWTLSLLYAQGGIVTASLDGTSVGSIDTSGSGAGANHVSDITGITVATTGAKRLLLQVSAASNASVYMILQHITLFRTA